MNSDASIYACRIPNMSKLEIFYNLEKIWGMWAKVLLWYLMIFQKSLNAHHDLVIEKMLILSWVVKAGMLLIILPKL